jgi:NAD+ synthetase
MNRTEAQGETVPLPAIEPAQTVEVIVAFIRSQLEQAGFERLVIGLSGGVDSATVAFLAARAIGADNLLAIRMPYRTSSEASETDALRVVDALGCRTERVEVTPMVEPMLELIADGDPAALDVRRGNVMARQRMIVLYDRSAGFDALVVGTSNKTEALLGYGTLFGDMAAALQPIGDLYKSQLRAVASELGVPEEVVRKPPSADLWPGQTDRWFPGIAAAMPASIPRRVASISCRTSAGGVPTNQVRAQSACQPSTMQPMSMLTRSPSVSRRRGDGMPCTTSSLTLAQITPGNGGFEP